MNFVSETFELRIYRLIGALLHVKDPVEKNNLSGGNKQIFQTFHHSQKSSWVIHSASRKSAIHFCVQCNEKF